MAGMFRKTERGFAILGILSLAGLALMQLARIERHNARIDQSDTIEVRTRMPEQIAGILHRVCRDCHTEQTVWPWYSNFAPTLWLMAADVNAGRERMNLSRWGRYRVGEQIARLNGICEMVQKNKCPFGIIGRCTPRLHCPAMMSHNCVPGPIHRARCLRAAPPGNKRRLF